MDLDEAKRRVDIYKLWDYYFPGRKYGRVCRSPFREDSHPSFSIFDEGRAFKDFGFEEHRGDVVCFVELAENCDTKTAIKRVIEFAGGDADAPPPSAPPASPPPSSPAEKDRGGDGKIVLPALSAGTDRDFETILKVRGWENESDAGLRELERRGLLRFCTHQGDRYWFVMDGELKNAQMRLVNGRTISVWDKDLQDYNHIKAKTWPGSRAGWLLGQVPASSFNVCLWCEGGPDFLAAAITAEKHGVLDRCGLVCQTGAGQDAFFERGFEGVIVVFVQDDLAGYKMLQRISDRYADLPVVPWLAHGGDLADFLAGKLETDFLCDLGEVFEVAFGYCKE